MQFVLNDIVLEIQSGLAQIMAGIPDDGDGSLGKIIDNRYIYDAGTQGVLLSGRVGCDGNTETRSHELASEGVVALQFGVILNAGFFEKLIAEAPEAVVFRKVDERLVLCFCKVDVVPAGQGVVVRYTEEELLYANHIML